MAGTLNELLGPSNFLLVLEMFLDNPCQWMNLREIARRVNKNPGTISPIMPTLIERKLIVDCKVGLKSVVYELNWDSGEVQALLAMKKCMAKPNEG